MVCHQSIHQTQAPMFFTLDIGNYYQHSV